MASSTTPLTRGQRKTLLTYAAALGAVAAAATGWAAVEPWVETGGASGYLALIVAAITAPCAVALVNAALGRIVADDSGLWTRRPLRRRAFAWDEIAAVEVKAAEERSGTVYRLVVVTRSGKRRVLPAPVSAWWGVDSDFGRTRRTLDERLAAARDGRGIG